MMEHRWRARIRKADPARRSGRVRRILPTYIVADGPAAPLGALCDIEAGSASETRRMMAEVVRVDRDNITLAALDDGLRTFPGALVSAVATTGDVPVGQAFLGRAVDPLGRPLDRLRPIRSDASWPLHAVPPSPLDRRSPRTVLATGIRAIDGLLTLGRGQRIGVFAPAGVGKTSLIGQFARQIDANITIIALVGERGREVEAFWDTLPGAIKARSTLVAATSDQPATMRVKAGYYAMALAEYWRAKGRHVLLLLDSVTRLAMALREIGLAAGEPPTVRAYTPNVFAAIPRLVERAGALGSGGAISAIMTVLSETEDIDDPISEMVKSLLDGHVLLSRSLAEQGHFPAIDVARSVSRQAGSLRSANQRRHAAHMLDLISAYEQSRMMRQAGLYAAGSDARIDEAVSRRDAIQMFLRQRDGEHATLEDIDLALAQLAGERA